MTTSAVLLNYTSNLKSTILQYFYQRASFKSNLTLRSTIKQHGDQRANFKLKSIWVCVSRKELPEAVRFRTHNWNNLVLNPGALTISFKGSYPRYKENKFTQFTFYEQLYNVGFYYCLYTYIN